jgi:hypothetical protein
MPIRSRITGKTTLVRRLGQTCGRSALSEARLTAISGADLPCCPLDNRRSFRLARTCDAVECRPLEADMVLYQIEARQKCAARVLRLVCAQAELEVQVAAQLATS